ncbi:MAG: L,D-transpeptidase family protein [Longimicrobiales bacterium]
MKPGTRFHSGVAYCALLLSGTAMQAGAQAAAAHRVSSTAAVTARSKLLVAESSFAQEQLQYSRVRKAQRSAGPKILRLFTEKGIRYPAAEVYLRAFKQERALEVWVRPANETRFQLLNTYAICAASGELGPKRRQGDAQVPEGFYTIDRFNPFSSYHLSMRVNYPNQRDRIVNRGRRMGGDIYIHGSCKSIGCLAVTDGGIEEIYWLAVEARAMGQRSIPVHIFPARMESSAWRRVRAAYSSDTELLDFWETLEPGYSYFEKHRRLPPIAVSARGVYALGRVST